MADKPKLKTAGFDYADGHRGYWARLRDGAGRTVTLTEFPASLLSMLKAKILIGEAKEDAERIAAERRDPESPGRKAWTDWRKGQDAIHL